MRAFVCRPFLLTLGLLAAGLAATPAPTRAADADVTGSRKLVFLSPFSEMEMFIADFKDGGKARPEVTSFQVFPSAPTVSVVETKGDTIGFQIAFRDSKIDFSGKPGKDGTVYGTLSVQGNKIPARLEKATSAKVEPVQQKAIQEAMQPFSQAMGNPDVKSRNKALREILAKKPGSPTLSGVYSVVLRDADKAGLTEAEVKSLVGEWVDGAKLYGDAYASDIQLDAVRSLAGKAAYSKVALAMAKDAEKSMGESAPVESRAELARALATAAKASGDADLAKTAAAKADKLEGELDEEYHKKVPPFKTAVLTPKDRKSDKVLLMELFTGAQCPPCVAADVAFDGLIQTYRPTELVTLQYHLHIPGPDPMTNADSVERAGYYPDLGGTPSVYFDGTTEGTGGGGMAQSKAKYDNYRAIIDKSLSAPSGATIDLKVDRDGDGFKITAKAEAKPEQLAKDSTKVGGSKLKLRLALVEEVIRYTGGNKLRFHHHVVRAMPGGAAGQALKGGKGSFETTIKVADLKKGLETYLSDFTKKGATFANTPPMDLSKLAVVAFVQDDSDKSVLNAAMAPVGETK